MGIRSSGFVASICLLLADCVEKVEMPRRRNLRKSELITDFG
jgi:hypothetical protein